MPDMDIINGDNPPHIVVPKPEILKAAVKHIEEHIEHWNQSDWAHLGSRLPDDEGDCGTTACLAGHILLSQGEDWGRLVAMDNESIPGEALDVLGFDRFDPNRSAFDSNIFMHTYDVTADPEEDDFIIGYTPEKLAKFKAYVTKVTGVEFE